MQVFIQQIFNGIFLGSIYALLALGYTMVYGIIGLINFAHGDVYMIGAFIGFYLITSLHLNFWVTLILTMAACALIGMLIEFLAYRPLRHHGAPKITALITAIGVSFLLENGMTFLFGGDSRPFPQAIKLVTYHIGFLDVTNIQILIFVVAVALMIALQFIVQKTKMGRAMRAVSVDTEAASIVGIKVDQTISFTFAIGSALAGAAGVLIGLYYNSIDPLMGMTPGIKAFIAAVVGGIGVIPGAALGGWLIGLIETLTYSIGISSWKDAAVYAVLILVLLVRPTGIFGKKEGEKV
ncbi:branched-chain amino acid ABC transporter permease [Xylocopilactobacillus apicola]|uniref:Branched-chain amino acid ABC transporter permease n=1 Tax=Xylocopilactobacillus apicola TaxID=2932184 RepID=A0AAU9D355_9LACO|nr:branched-chain amino acid ABC transporter permease [Xylocopilactobacillus apicola]BDR57883.1 branched-chain amino acid ABC transporter permease [Xylocopilactobacillus apicola]